MISHRHNDQTYVETDQRLAHTETHEWNHGLGEAISALLAHSLPLSYTLVAVKA